jgi:uncharacterized phage protein (TIGR01671 family)
MREIKFRAWDKADKMMYYDIQNGIKFDDGSHYCFCNFINGDPVLGVDYHDWVLEQWTGLHDSQGKEIYEGDLIKSIDATKTWEVVFDDACFWVRTHTRMIELYEYDKDDIKVVGNIHEGEKNEV